MKRILYIGWIGYGNLGDELMFDLFKQQCSTLGDSYKLDSTNVEYRYLKNIPTSEYDLIVLGGGSILSSIDQIVHPYIINFLYDCLSSNKKVMLWGSGIDWVPRSAIAHLKDDKDIPLTLSEDMKARLVHVLQKSVWAGVRGPLTARILEQCGARVYISGDPGFLLAQPDMLKEVNVPLDPRMHTASKIIGVNWGTSFNAIYGQDEVSVEDSLANALNKFTKQGYLIYLYTVWKSDLPSIERLYAKLHDKNSVILDKRPHHQDELISLLQSFTFTINFKLHANYISLAANTPFIALGYRFKVFDFIHSVHLEDYIISTDDQNIDGRLLSLEPLIIKNRDSIVEAMQAKQDMFRERIGKPFEDGLYL